MDNRIFTCTPIIRKFTIFSHGKTRFADRISLWKQFEIFRVTFVERNDTLAII